MNVISQSTNTDKRKFLRTQQLSLLGLAAIALIMAWFDGISGFVGSFQDVYAGRAMVKVSTRWYMTSGLSLVSLVMLVMAGIAHYRQQLFEVATLVVCGAVAAGVVIALGVVILIGFDNWIGTQGYERCTALDIVKGVTRHGTRSVEVSAWTPIGQCRSS